MSEEFSTRLARAEVCEQVIARFRKKDDSAGTEPRLNFAAKEQIGWLDVVRSYQEAFEIYRDLNQPEQASRLLDDLLDLVGICDEFTSSLAIQLLLTMEDSYRWLDRAVPGTNERLKTALRIVIGQKLLQKEMEYWLIIRVLNLLRDMADDDQERRPIDASLCQTIEMGAQASYSRGNYDNAEAWYREAATIAQDRIGSSDLSKHFLRKADSIQQIRTQEWLNSDAVQATASKDLSSPGQAASMHNVSIGESIEVMLQKAMEEQHSERFLPELEELITEYELHDDRLSRVVNDDRLLLDMTKIEEREYEYQGKGLLGVLPGQFVDARGNPRDEFDASDRFIVQYVNEVAAAVATLFQTWQANGHLTEAQTIKLLNQDGSFYDDWRIFNRGLSRHYQSDYVAASHMLIPQFENIVRSAAEKSDIAVKKLKRSVPGDVLLNDLINPQNDEMRELLGDGLFDLIYWYLANGDSPFGYRHKVAHGWISPEECNYELSAMTIWLTLKVVDAIR